MLRQLGFGKQICSAAGSHHVSLALNSIVHSRLLTLLCTTIAAEWYAQYCTDSVAYSSVCLASHLVLAFAAPRSLFSEFSQHGS